MTVILIVTTVLAVAGAVAFIGLALWAAREDGRDQRRRDERLGSAGRPARRRTGAPRGPLRRSARREPRP
ncbi:MAG TPA: hypothetical protein VH572_11130 [Gaiella sp.]